MQGLWLRAVSKISLIFCSLSPMYLLKMSVMCTGLK
jgi:hypothetical protein